MSEIKVITKDPFDIAKSAVDKAVDLIKPTYGPAGNKVIISKMLHKVIVDDGVQIARDLELSDPLENAVWERAKEVAIRTNDRAGDGTTGSLIMLQAIMSEVAKQNRRDGRKIEKELHEGLISAKEQLLKIAKPVKTLAELQKVARISYDNPEVADLIADTWFKMGKDGVVTLDSSPTMKTTAEMAAGLSFKRGYISPYMITDGARMEAVIEKPYILLTDYRITEAGDILPVMNLLASKQIFQLVIVADSVEQSALATIIVNKMQGKFNVVAINVPPGENKTVVLEDLGILLGAKVFSGGKGDKLETVKLEDLGRAERFTAKQDSSVFLGPKGAKANVEKAIADLKLAIEAAEAKSQKEVIETRLATFTNKVAVIRVGASTESEQRALRYKVEDAVNSVKAAFRGGVVCGAGLSLFHLDTPSRILNEALKYPYRQLMHNVGLDIVDLKSGTALNVVTGKTGNFLEVGVIDPVEVLIAGVESAVSIASLLITTSGMIVEPPAKSKE